MGIKGLNKLIKNFAPSAIEQINAKDLRGSKVAIDSELLLHKYKSNDNKNNSYTINNTHIYGFIGSVFWFLENGITPIYVFDGRPNVAKQENALHKRSTYKEQINEKIKGLKNKCMEHINTIDDTGSVNSELDETLNQLFKIQKKLSYMSVSKNHRNECKYVLKLLGIPFVIAHEDAEAYCVNMIKTGHADYVYTEDTDAIPYVLGHMPESYHNVKILRKGPEPYTFTAVNIGEIIDKMKLTPTSFIDMCILCGCDFCKTVPRLGPFKSFAMITEHGSIERVIENRGGWGSGDTIDFPDNFKYQDARDIFCGNGGNIKNGNDEKMGKITEKKDKTFDLTGLDIENFKTFCFTERNMNPYPVIEKYYRIIGTIKEK
jgi:flap endonuclease-1